MALHIVTTRPWKAERLGAEPHDPAGVIDTSAFVDGVDAVWLPASAASVHWATARDGWSFQDALWWRLPEALLGRRVVHGGEEDVRDRLRSGPGFVKLARHKYDYFPARMRTCQEFEHDLQARPWLPLHEFVWSEPMEIVAEYRVWAAAGRVLYGCDYPVDRPERPDFAPAPPEVLAFAARAAGSARGALVIDVGRAPAGGLVVIETNPVWCAGFLGAPREVLAEALLASQGRAGVADPYVPDAAVQQMLAGPAQR